MILSVAISVPVIARIEFYNAKKMLALSIEDIGGELDDDLPDPSDEKLVEKIMDMVQHKHFGQTGSFLLCDKDLTVCASTDDKYNVMSLAGLTDTGGRNIKDIDSDNFFLTSLDGTYNLTYIDSVYDHYLMVLYPVEEAFEILRSSIISLIVMEAVLFPALFLIVFLFLKRRVINGVIRLNSSLEAIAEGDLNEKADVHSSFEFESLSDNINITVRMIRRMARNETKMLEDEMSYARAIQQSALPQTFPAFPDRQEFGIYASMRAAKEVGGDFYDFYMISLNKLIFLIADVSGKGIPAALFMMSAKSVIKSFTETGLSPAEVFTEANRELSGKGDKVDMFVTAWMGVLDLPTGNLKYVNAGHNPPILIHEGKPDYLDQDPEMAMCAFDGYEYKEQELHLSPGDAVLLYTDGVTEAKNSERKQYREERLQKLLADTFPTVDTDIKGAARKGCEAVLDDVLSYSKDVPQSDDITVLCITYRGSD